MNPTTQALKIMLEENEKVRKQNPELRQQMSWRHYVSELCTIHFNPGRRTGKTEAINALAQPGDLIIVSKDMLIRHLYKNPPCNIVSAPHLKHRPPAYVYERIFIDELSEETDLVKIADTTLDPQAEVPQIVVVGGRI